MRTQRLILHPVFFALYPIAAMFSHNMREEFLGATLQPIVFVLLAVVLLWLGLATLLRNGERSAILVSLALVMFFSYGHVFSLVENRTIGSFEYGRQRYALAILGLVSFFAAFATLRTKRDLRRLTSLLNVAGTVLILIPVSEIAWYEARGRARGHEIGHLATMDDVEWTDRDSNAGPGYLPDIYYLVFDRYTSNSVLKSAYGFDNSEFLDGLRKLGFYVAENSRCNYAGTFLSLASTLNLSDLDAFQQEAANSSDRTAVYRQLQNFKVQRYLHSSGYHYVHLGSWWSPTRSNRYADSNIEYGPRPSEFVLGILRTTLAAPFLHGLNRSLMQKQRILFKFTRMDSLVSELGPKFVFLHMLSPHDPYLFDRNGNTLTPAKVAGRSEGENYIDQLQFLNTKILSLVARIQETSPRPPVILVTSDEGLALPEISGHNVITPETALQRTGILNAYYLPGVDTSGLYSSITPVNSFRLVFNLYFGAHYELLPDRVYWYDDPLRPYRFLDVTSVTESARSAIQTRTFCSR